MTRGKKIENEYRQYVGIEPGLMEANRKYISVDKDDLDLKKKIVEEIVHGIIILMQAESETFKYLFVDTFGGGSGYEGLKITRPDEFDIDILMRIPKFTKPILLESNIPGYVSLRLENLHKLRDKNPQVYTEMQSFVDEKNYVLTKELKKFMQSIFDRIMNTLEIFLGNVNFKITRIQSLGPAFTLTIVGKKKFNVSVDLVPCILLNENQWPQNGFESNPYKDPRDFFIVPKSPKRDIPHIERYWRLSFQKQEREIIFDRQWLKPTIRILKKVRDFFGHKISSYAIKSMFLKELKLDNPSLDEDTPELWLSPLSYCVVYMLEMYANYLENGRLPYFWNKKMDLFEDLSPEQKLQYKLDIERMLDDIKTNSTSETVLKYLR